MTSRTSTAPDDPIAKIRARHYRNQHGECTGCMECSYAPWPCPTYLDTETDVERAEREAADAEAERATRLAERIKAYRKAVSEQQSAYKRAIKMGDGVAEATTAVLAEVDGNVDRAAAMLGIPVQDVRRMANLGGE